VTLIELVVAIVITGIVLAMTVYFANPVRQSVDLAGRADLTDAADNALQRIGRDVRLALPNSVRVTNVATGQSVTVRINDRGPYIDGRCLDLSTAAFSKIARTSSGVIKVNYEVLRG